jgi:hypothetical protein
VSFAPRPDEFIAGLGAAGWPLLVRAQQQTKPTIAWLDQRQGVPPREFIEAFCRGLAEIGFLVLLCQQLDEVVEIIRFFKNGHFWKTTVISIRYSSS